MNEPYRLRYTSQIVGAFMLVLLLGLIVGLGYLLQRNSAFSEKVRYWISVDEERVPDLPKGTEVMILGERAGQVEGMEYLEDSDRVKVVLSINANKRDQIYEESIVKPMRKLGVAGTILVIHRAKNHSKEMNVLEPDNQIMVVDTQSEADRLEAIQEDIKAATEAITKIQQRFDPTMKNVTNTSATLNKSLNESINPAADSISESSKKTQETMRNIDRANKSVTDSIVPKSSDAFDAVKASSDSFKQSNEEIRPEALATLEQIKAASTRVEDLTRQLEYLVDNDVKLTLNGVREASDQTSTTAKTIDSSTKETNESIQSTLTDLRGATEEIRSLAVETREVVRIVRGEAEELPGTVSNFNNAVDDTQDMVGEIRSHWLLRRYSKRAEPTRQLSPSSVRGGTAR